MSLEDQIRSVLSDTLNLPQDFLNGMVQFQAQNQLPVKTLHTPIFDVRDYGAVGDGVTDDTTAIQSAVKAASASGGIVSFAANASHLINTYISITGSGVTILGNGATVKLGSSYASGAQGQGHFYANAQTDIIIDGLRFDGNTGVLAADTGSNFAVLVDGSSRVTVRNCYAANLNGGGSNVNSAFVFRGLSHFGRAANNNIVSCNGGAILFQGAHCIAQGNILFTLGDGGIVFNSSNCKNGLAIGNSVDLISAQAAFVCETGAYDWSITGNVVSRCFAALDINDAGYAGSVLGGGVFSSNCITDADKGASSQTSSLGIFIRGAKVRDILISNNLFSGLTVYGTVDSFIYASTTTEGVTIRNNIFESKAQSLPAAIIFSANAHSRAEVSDNVIRSTSSVTKLSRGIWLQNGSTFTEARIARNKFENITNYSVHFDTSVTWSGQLHDNRNIAGVGAMYQTSPWGTLTLIPPHILDNTGRSRMIASAIPASGTWQQADIVWSAVVAAAGIPGWVCTTAGTPGTWKAMAAVAA